MHQSVVMCADSHACVSGYVCVHVYVYMNIHDFSYFYLLTSISNFDVCILASYAYKRPGNRASVCLYAYMLVRLIKSDEI